LKTHTTRTWRSQRRQWLHCQTYELPGCGDRVDSDSSRGISGHTTGTWWTCYSDHMTRSCNATIWHLARRNRFQPRSNIFREWNFFSYFKLSEQQKSINI